jgi:purine nucleoside phosphorylase
MSTAAEVTAACHAGMMVLGISLISNVAIDTVRSAPEGGASHEEVLRAGQQAVPVLVALLEGFLKRLS